MTMKHLDYDLPEESQIKKLNLLESGGTDYHGDHKPNINIGFGYEDKPLKIPYEFLHKMKEKHEQL